MVYRIVFDITTPIITTAPIHLDGILSSVHPAMHNLEEQLTRFSGLESVKAAPILMDSAKIGSQWVWCCSAGEYDDAAAPFHDKFVKRKGADETYYLSKNITPTMGTGKDCMETVYGVICQSISFLFSARTPRDVRRLAKRVHNIGSKRKMGYGQVKGYRIEETEMNWKSVIVQNGVAMRNLPASMIDAEELTRIHVRHPYWMPANIEDGVEVGMPCSLKEEVYLREA